MVHLDLFSGIGGFAYAVDQVWDNVAHIFCDNDKFCQEVLKKHWPESEVYDDIKKITAHTYSPRREGQDLLRQRRQSRRRRDQRPFLLTGGFPCQPFSAAGLRRGTADDRYLWPEMLRVIRLTQPEWVVAENVRGLLTWNDGMVFEQVCADLEAAGYEVQPLIIPAVAVNAPHRRDRIWFIAHAIDSGQGREKRGGAEKSGSVPQEHRTQDSTTRQLERAASNREALQPTANTNKWQSGSGTVTQPDEAQELERGTDNPSDWSKDWMEVAAQLCSVDDGLPVELDGFKLSKAQHRAAQLKGYGNAIVPQVAIEILKAIKISTNSNSNSLLDI